MPSLAPVRAPSASRPGPALLSLALAAVASATALLAMWLAFTVVAVLPARDPAHVPLWAGVAVGFLVFAAISLAAVVPGPLAARARWVAGVLGVAAAGLGLGAVVRTLSGRGHFEGYLVLMGFVLAAHGVLALLHAFATPASRA
jgi:hypothetical protein